MREQLDAPTRHPHKALTAQAVRAFTATGKLQRIADGGGLYLLVSPSGAKSWVLRTVIKRKRSDLGLGGLATVTLAEAREEASRLRKIARAGGDPLAARRQERRPVPTFREAAEQVHAGLSPSFKNEKHRNQWLSSLAGALAAFGAKRVDAITGADILPLLSAEWLRTPETSRRVLQRIRAIFEWCKAHRYCSGDNPTQGLKPVLPKQRGEQRHHAALPYPQVPAFIQTLRGADSREVVRLAFEFLILTATRTNEVVLATWAEVDLAGKTWTVPAARMKAGVEHRVPLSDRAVAILERAKVLADGSPYVFPGRAPKQPLSNMAFLMVLRRLGRTDITAHGFRSSFRDWASERTNAPRAVCEAALAHSIRDKVEAAYHRTDLFERRRSLMAAWAALATATPAAVVAIGA
jgi:integrase